MIKQMPASEFLELGVGESRVKNVADKLREKIVNYSATALVFFQNMDMSSSQMGNWQLLPVGPNNKYKTVEECDGKHLNDLPSQRQYAQAWCPADELLKAL